MHWRTARPRDMLSGVRTLSGCHGCGCGRLGRQSCSFRARLRGRAGNSSGANSTIFLLSALRLVFGCCWRPVARTAMPACEPQGKQPQVFLVAEVMRLCASTVAGP